jgi:hypothetical protein
MVIVQAPIVAGAQSWWHDTRKGVHVPLLQEKTQLPE